MGELGHLVRPLPFQAPRQLRNPVNRASQCRRPHKTMCFDQLAATWKWACFSGSSRLVRQVSEGLPQIEQCLVKQLRRRSIEMGEGNSLEVTSATRGLVDWPVVLFAIYRQCQRWTIFLQLNLAAGHAAFHGSAAERGQATGLNGLKDVQASEVTASGNGILSNELRHIARRPRR